MVWIVRSDDLRREEAKLRIGGGWICVVVTEGGRGYTVLAVVPARIAGERS